MIPARILESEKNRQLREGCGGAGGSQFERNGEGGLGFFGRPGGHARRASGPGPDADRRRGGDVGQGKARQERNLTTEQQATGDKKAPARGIISTSEAGNRFYLEG